MHLATGADYLSSEYLTDGLMAEAHAQYGFPAGESLYDIKAYAGIGRCARPGRNEDSLRIEFLGLGRCQFVVTEDAHAHAKLAEILDQVERERIVVVDDQQHF